MNNGIPWGQGGSDRDPRYIHLISSRRRCSCGCGGRITHAGMANGVALANGCELSIRRWVRNPADVDRRTRGLPILNDHEKAALWLISVFVTRFGVNPTFDDLRGVLALRSRAGAVRVTNNLIRKGVIERPADSGELIRITALGRASLAKEGKSDD